MIENSHLYREIHEQPDVLARFLDAEQQTMQKLAKEIRTRRISHVFIAARGTSDNAARYAKYVLGGRNRLPVALAAPSLFSIYKTPPTFGNALVLGISQSGKSPDIVAVLAEARKQGVLTAVITNEPDSDLARKGDFVIPLHAGEEKAVAATKTYTSELAAIALLSASLTEEPDALEHLLEVPGAVKATLALDAEIQSVAPRYRYMEQCVVIGRGFNYSTAFELALKITELTYTIVEPYSSADFLHGPLAMVEPGFPVILIAPQGVLIPEIREFSATLRNRQAEIVTISDDPELLSGSRIPIGLPRPVPEWLSPITAIVPGQLLALHLAHARDFNVDSPRAIRKITETR